MNIMAIAFAEHKPHSVLVDSDGCCEIYDVDYCKRDDTLYYHMSGCGPAYIEAAPGMRVWVAEGNHVAIPAGCEMIASVDAKWLDPEMDWGIDCDTEYCEACDDWLPTDTDEPCPHIRWDEETGTWKHSGATKADGKGEA